MPATRREFLSRAALAAAMAGVDPDIASIVSKLGQAARPSRALAIRCAQWIDRSAQPSAGGVAWPADPAKPAAAIGLDFYNGTPGVVSFLANLQQATGDARWREQAQQGGAYLVAESTRRGDGLDAGLYTGLAGLATTFMVLDATGVGPSWRGAARQAASKIVARAKTVGDGVEWADANDIISGTAGTGLFLLHAADAWGDTALGNLAVRAGRRLLKTAQPAEGGLMWFPSASLARNYPNFSHGTAGVAYFLATLHQHTKERAFLDGALAGARYLDAVATRRNGARAIFHMSGGGEDRFYLSWCHGPVGTARLFYRLLQITGEPKWRQWIDELTAWLVASGAPEQPSAGYWNNISQCCGNVGMGQYCLDLARHYPMPVADTLRARISSNTLSRATDDEAGLRWVQAENRVQPENLVAQTGFMQGAAGVGTFFLQLDAFERGAKWPTPMPDTPWA
jgi:lantibiotic modifying enzyme